MRAVEISSMLYDILRHKHWRIYRVRGCVVYMVETKMTTFGNKENWLMYCRQYQGE